MIQDTAGMFRRLGTIAIALEVITIPAASAADASPRAAVKVVYVAPGKFTDVGDNGYVTTDARRDALLAQLAAHVEKRAAGRIPSGGTLAVTITDVDMAGGFEPGRAANADRVRIVRDVYPPRIKLDFRLADAGGKVVAEGRRELTDLSFMTNAEYRGDLLRYEKKLLDDWLDREFSGSAAARGKPVTQ